MIAGVKGVLPDVCSGLAVFNGPVLDGRVGELIREKHTWLDVPGFGKCDLSPDLRIGQGPGWSKWPSKHLLASRFGPSGGVDFRYCYDESSFEQHLSATRSKSPCFSAVYAEVERHRFDEILFADAVNFSMSPLLKDLSATSNFSLDILGKAALHVWHLYHGKAKTLTGLDPSASWRSISRIDSKSVEHFRQRIFRQAGLSRRR